MQIKPGILYLSATLLTSDDTSCGSGTDSDQDQFYACLGEPAVGDISCDCDDSNPAIYPGALETDNNIDDDCDGSVEFRRYYDVYDTSFDFRGNSIPSVSGWGTMLVPAYGQPSVEFSLLGFELGRRSVVCLDGQTNNGDSIVVSPEGNVWFFGGDYDVDGGSRLCACQVRSDYSVVRSFIISEPLSLSIHGNVFLGSGDILKFGSENPPNTDRDALIMRVTQEGEVVWRKTFGGEHDDYFDSVVVDSNDNIYVTGPYCQTASCPGTPVMSLSPDGTVRWERQLGTSVKIDNLIHMSNDDIVVLGRYAPNPLITRMTSDGVVLWTALSSLVGYSPFGLETLTGDIQVISYGSCGQQCSWTQAARYSGDGRQLWTREFVQEHDHPLGLVQLDTGDFIMTAYCDNAPLGCYVTPGILRFDNTFSNPPYQTQWP